MLQAITIKFLSPTNTRGARLKASCFGGSVTIDFDYAATPEQRITQAVDALIDKMGWHNLGGYTMGSLQNGDYVAVFNN